MLSKLPAHFRLVRAVAPSLHLLVPVDVADFVDKWPIVLAHAQGKFAVVVIYAWLKLPSSRAVFLSAICEQREGTVESVLVALERTL